MDFGFQYYFPQFLTVFSHCMPISGRNFNCIVFSKKIFFTGLVCQPNAQLPTWRARVSLSVWNLTVDLSGLGDPVSSYATASISLEIIGARKPHLHDKAETPPGGLHDYIFEISDAPL
jgi:hypothetical protein